MNPRHLDIISKEYNSVCRADELIIDQVLTYQNRFPHRCKSKKIPKPLLAQHKLFTQRLKELDEERNYALPFGFNFYRHHYSQDYPAILKKSLRKAQKSQQHI